VADGLAFNAVWNAGMLQVTLLPSPHLSTRKIIFVSIPTTDNRFGSVGCKQNTGIRATAQELGMMHIVLRLPLK
jgi:hypothetical protein